MGRMNLDDLRSQLPVTNEVAYFQTGTYGPTLAAVLKVVAECMQYEANHGPARPSTRQLLVDKEEAARRSLAELLNVKPDELGNEILDWKSTSSPSIKSKERFSRLSYVQLQSLCVASGS